MRHPFETVASLFCEPTDPLSDFDPYDWEFWDQVEAKCKEFEANPPLGDLNLLSYAVGILTSECLSLHSYGGAEQRYSHPCFHRNPQTNSYRMICSDIDPKDDDMFKCYGMPDWQSGYYVIRENRIYRYTSFADLTVEEIEALPVNTTEYDNLKHRYEYQLLAESNKTKLEAYNHVFH